jgi:hypothetical protein
VYEVLVDVPPKGDVYADEPWLTIWWDRAHNCVHGEWKAFATSVEFRAGLMKGLEAIRDKRATGYVSDTRKVKVIVHKDQAWVKETWIPLAKAAGLKRVALVTGAGGLGRITVLEIVEHVEDEVFLRSFDTLAEAFSWVAKA